MDNKKDKVDTMGQSSGLIKTIVFNIFEKDNFLLFVYKKFERIVSAVYLVTNFLSDNEPIKWRLREVGVDILSSVLSLKNPSSLKSEVFPEIVSDTLKILSCLDVLYSAGSISEMNLSILKKELEALLETISFGDDAGAKYFGTGGTLRGDFFAIPRDQFTPPSVDVFEKKAIAKKMPNRRNLPFMLGPILSERRITPGVRLKDILLCQN